MDYGFDDYLWNTGDGANIIVETVGMPGSGKTFICKIIAMNEFSGKEKFEFHSIDNYHKNRFLRYFSKSLIIVLGNRLNPRIIFYCLKLAKNFSIRQIQIKTKLIFNLLLICAIIGTSKRKKMSILLDQGLVQAVWSYLYYSEDFKFEETKDALCSDILRILNYFNFDRSHILSLTVNHRIVQERLFLRHNRGNSAMNDLSERSFQKGVEATKNMNLILSELEAKSKNFKCFEVFN